MYITDFEQPIYKVTIFFAQATLTSAKLQFSSSPAPTPKIQEPPFLFLIRQSLLPKHPISEPKEDPCGVLTCGRSHGGATEAEAAAAEGGSGAGARGADESEAQAGWRRRLAWGGGGGGGGHRHGESTGEEGGRAGVSSVC